MPRLTRPKRYVARLRPQQRDGDPDANYCDVVLEFQAWCAARQQPFRREMIAAMRQHMQGRDTQGVVGSE